MELLFTDCYLLENRLLNRTKVDFFFPDTFYSYNPNHNILELYDVLI